MQSDNGIIDNPISYLASLNRHAYNLVAIHPTTNEIKGLTATIDNINPFISAHINDYNLYYTVNEPSINAPNNKLKKEHITKLHGVWLDADPVKGADFQGERGRLLKFADLLKNQPTPPTYIIDSGAGVQAFWYLTEPLDATNDNINTLESLGRGISIKYDTDAVQNIDRIMRLPFTNNIPDERKQKIGRTRATARILHQSNKTYQLNDLLTLAELIDSPEYDDLNSYDFDYNALSDNLSEDLIERWKKVRQDEKIKGILNANLPSRSEYDMALISRLKDLEWPLQDIAQIAYVFPKGKNKDLTKREIIRTYSRAKGSLGFLALDQATIEAIMQQKNPTVVIIEKPTRKYKPAGSLSWKKTTTPLLKNFIDQGTVVAIYGQSNVGKSFIATDIAAHIAMGRDWAGYKLKQRSSVLYVAAEASATYGKRVDAVKIRMGIPMTADMRVFPYGVYDDHLNIMDKLTTKDGRVICPGVEQLVAEAGFIAEDSGFPCRLIVIDTLSAVFGGGNENSPDDMGLLVDHALQLSKRTGATVIIVHHSGKDQAAGLRGHTKLIGALDTSLEVRITNIGAKEKRELIAKKQRDNDKGVAVEFNLNIVKLGQDDDGDDVTSCNIVLENDALFTPIIPDKLGKLTLTQRAMYNAVYCANLGQNNSQGMVFAWYKHFLDNPTNDMEVVQKSVQMVSGLTPLKGVHFGSKKSTLYNQCPLLQKEGLIDKNEQDQWVIL